MSEVRIPSQDDEDIEATNELPVLSEAAIVSLGEAAADSEARASQDEQTARVPFPKLERRREFEQRMASLEGRIGARDAAVEELGSRVGEIARGWGSVETQLTRNATAIELIAEELGRLRSRLERPASGATAESSGDTRSELAALTDYITNRREHWDELEARVAEQAQRIRELETELEQRVERQHEAEELAARESARAAEYRAELAHRAAPFDGAPPASNGAQAPARGPAAAPEGLGELGDELAELRGVLDEQRAHLDAATPSAADDSDAVHERLAAAESELEQARADLKRIERALRQRERTADDQSARIAALQHQLSAQVDRLRDLRNLGGTPEAREAATIAAAGSGDVPELGALVCLTSERPEHYAIARRQMVIGRSTEADIRIPTHFVSREHARVRNDGRAVYIDDLGSTNGVFVNSIRVDSQELHDGDWITIGETQFRYIGAPSPGTEP